MSQTLIIFSGIVSLVLSILIGTLVLFSGLKLFDRFNKNINKFEELKNNNKAVGIVCGSYILAYGISIESALQSLTQSFNRILWQSNQGFNDAFTNGLTLMLQFFLACACTSLGLWLASLLFTKLTKNLNEIDEIKNGNIAVALLYSSILITISFVMRTGISKLITAIEKRPEILSDSIQYFG